MDHNARNGRDARFVTVRLPEPFRAWAKVYLENGNSEPVSDEAIEVLFQRVIDELFSGPAERGDDPPCCDPGGGMRHPGDIDDACPF